MTLIEFGFTSWFEEQARSCLSDGYQAARVTAIHKGWCDISDGTRTRPAKTAGKLRRAARETKDYLTVGDWVLAARFDSDDFAWIDTVLDRKNALIRKAAGRKVSGQILAANVDTAFVLHALDPGFNLRKLERYLSIVNESKIEAAVLLSKRDLLSFRKARARLNEVKSRMPGVPVFAFSNTTRKGLRSVRSLFKPEKTYCLLGASGSGKTSLINSMFGETDRYFTLPVRESDGKGVHSTTWRELIVLNNGALVIDTPGVRELGYLDGDAGLKETFEEITAIEKRCRFKDCTHVNTAGCAVLAAVESEAIDKERYDHFIRMRQEAAANSRAQLEKSWKTRGAPESGKKEQGLY